MKKAHGILKKRPAEIVAKKKKKKSEQNQSVKNASGFSLDTS